jgi:hypothetical protein
VACLLASGKTSYRRSALAGWCMLRCINERPAPNSLALRGEASARGDISLGSRAAASVLHIHPGQVQGFFVPGGSVGTASGIAERRGCRGRWGCAIGTGSIDRYQLRGDFYMPRGEAIPGLPQQRSQERRGLRDRLFPALRSCPGGLSYKPVM